MGGGSFQDMKWGTLGPDAVTYYFHKHGLLHYVLPVDVFYPVHHQVAALLLDQQLSYKDLITHRTKCIHLFNETFFQNLDLNFVQTLDLDNDIPKNSPLGELINLSRLN